MLDYYKGEGLDYWGSKQKITHSSVHWHKFYEMELILEGNGIEFINGIPYNVESGYLSIIPTGSFHSYEVLSGELHIFNICFEGSFLSSKVNHMLSSSGLPWLFKLDFERYDNIKSWFNMLSQMMNEENINKDSIVKRIIELILLFCPSTCENLVKEESERDSRQISVIRSVLSYIDEHYAEKISRDSLAESLCYSSCYFSTFFRKLSGITLSEYITSTRMNKAKELICNSDIPIAEIIKQVGYRSESLFYSAFRKYFGLNPNEIRRKTK